MRLRIACATSHFRLYHYYVMHTVLLCMHIAIMYMHIIILATLSLCSMFIGVYFEEELEALIFAMEFLPTTLARCISTHIYTYHRSGEIILYVNKVIGPLAGQATFFVKHLHQVKLEERTTLTQSGQLLRIATGVKDPSTPVFW